MKCGNCNCEILPGAKFCTNCGAPVKVKHFQAAYLWPVLYLLSIYLWPLGLELFSTEKGVQRNLFQEIVYSIVFLAPVIFGIINFIIARRLRKQGRKRELFTSAVIVKYGLVPFFLVGGCMIFALLIASIVPMMWIFGVPLMIPLFCSVGYLLMVLGSSYTISYSVAGIKDKTIPTALGVVYCILSFFFTLDVLAVVIASFKEKRFRPLTIVILVLLGILVLLVFSLIVYVFVKAGASFVL